MGLPWGPSEPGIADILSPSEPTFLRLRPLQRTLDKASSLQNLDSPTHSQLLISVTHNREDNFDLGGGHCITARNLSGGFPGDRDSWHRDTGSIERIVRL